jgi:hypothetical protein
LATPLQARQDCLSISSPSNPCVHRTQPRERPQRRQSTSNYIASLYQAPVFGTAGVASSIRIVAPNSTVSSPLAVTKPTKLIVFELNPTNRFVVPQLNSNYNINANFISIFDFVATRTHDGRPVRLLTLIDEYTRECLAIRVARRINSFGVIETMADTMLKRGIPKHIRSDNGPEMTARVVRDWLARIGSKTLFIEPGSPWENGYCESFNGKPRDELLNGEIF